MRCRRALQGRTVLLHLPPPTACRRCRPSLSTGCPLALRAAPGRQRSQAVRPWIRSSGSSSSCRRGGVPHRVWRARRRHGQPDGPRFRWRAAAAAADTGAGAADPHPRISAAAAAGGAGGAGGAAGGGAAPAAERAAVLHGAGREAAPLEPVRVPPLGEHPMPAAASHGGCIAWGAPAAPRLAPRSTAGPPHASARHCDLRCWLDSSSLAGRPPARAPPACSGRAPRAA